MRAIIDVLKRGHIVCLYPEGSRTFDGKIDEIKPGFCLLARRSKATIVPMVIDGVFERWPRTQKYPKPGGRVGIIYGKPIDADYIEQVGEEAFIAEFNQTMHTLHNDLRQKMGKNPLRLCVLKSGFDWVMLFLGWTNAVHLLVRGSAESGYGKFDCLCQIGFALHNMRPNGLRQSVPQNAGQSLPPNGAEDTVVAKNTRTSRTQNSRMMEFFQMAVFNSGSKCSEAGMTLALTQDLTGVCTNGFVWVSFFVFDNRHCRV